MPSPHEGGGRPDPRRRAPGRESAAPRAPSGAGTLPVGRHHRRRPGRRRHAGPSRGDVTPTRAACSHSRSSAPAQPPSSGGSESPFPARPCPTPALTVPRGRLCPGAPISVPGNSTFPMLRAETLGPPSTPRHRSRPACPSASLLLPHARQLQPAHCVHASSPPAHGVSSTNKRDLGFTHKYVSQAPRVLTDTWEA